MTMPAMPGADLVSRALPPRKVGVLARVILVVVCFFGCGVLVASRAATAPGVAGHRASRSSTAAEPASRAQPEAHVDRSRHAEVEVSNETLWRAYMNNDVVADQAYRGKLLEVTALVERINQDLTDSPYLTLRSPIQFMPTHAVIRASELGRAARLSPGDQVTLLCEGGGLYMGSPVLKDCTFSAR